MAPKASQPQWNGGVAPPCPGEGVLALRPAWEEGKSKEEVAPTPSFPEPLAQPSAPNSGECPHPRPEKPGLAALFLHPHFSVWLH